jgi:hypothetical protein
MIQKQLLDFDAFEVDFNKRIWKVFFEFNH